MAAPTVEELAGAFDIGPYITEAHFFWHAQDELPLAPQRTPTGRQSWAARQLERTAMKPHEQCRCEPDSKTTIQYLPPDPREDNKRPWHKHTLPRRKGGKR